MIGVCLLHMCVEAVLWKYRRICLVCQRRFSHMIWRFLVWVDRVLKKLSEQVRWAMEFGGPFSLGERKGWPMNHIGADISKKPPLDDSNNPSEASPPSRAGHLIRHQTLSSPLMGED